MTERREFFDFMLKRVEATAHETAQKEPQAFGRWFLNMYFQNPQDIFISDGPYDGKVDIFFTTHNGKTITYHILNSKFSREYNKQAPVKFYEEMTFFWHAFENKDSRGSFLEQAVKAELRPRYLKLFDAYDEGRAHLMFVTNHRSNEARYKSISNLPVETFHLDDLLQHLIDDTDGAMPRTPAMTLTGIQNVLSPDKTDTEVATSIVFAKLIDFIRYMQGDPFDLLFMRNVRVAISTAKSQVNSAIKETFAKNPEEFAYSNNGITMLCERQNYDPGSKELKLDNPRVVNGSQTLHSIRDLPNPSPKARAMIRIIEIPPSRGNDLPEQVRHKKAVIN